MACLNPPRPPSRLCVSLSRSPTPYRIVCVNNRTQSSDDMPRPQSYKSYSYKRLWLQTWAQILSLSSLALGKASCHVMKTFRQTIERPVRQKTEIPANSWWGPGAHLLVAPMSEFRSGHFPSQTFRWDSSPAQQLDCWSHIKRGDSWARITQEASPTEAANPMCLLFSAALFWCHLSPSKTSSQNTGIRRFASASCNISCTSSGILFVFSEPFLPAFIDVRSNFSKPWNLN